jgi:hypothetical protein
VFSGGFGRNFIRQKDACFFQRFRSGYQAQNYAELVPGGSFTKTLLRVWEKLFCKMKIAGNAAGIPN